MNPYEWNYYGAASVEGGLWRVGDYIYNWYPQSGDLFIYASPTANYGSAKQVKVTDTKMRDAIVAEIAAKGTKLNKDQARAAAADIEARNKKAAPVYTPAPATATPAPAESTSLIPTWIYDPNAAWYQQGYVYALGVTGVILVAVNWDTIKGMVGMGDSAATPALANPRKNKMKKYSNPRMNRKNRRRNREEEVEEEVEEIDEDEE
jgi:hypothetical protein